MPIHLVTFIDICKTILCPSWRRNCSLGCHGLLFCMWHACMHAWYSVCVTPLTFILPPSSSYCAFVRHLQNNSITSIPSDLFTYISNIQALYVVVVVVGGRGGVAYFMKFNFRGDENGKKSATISVKLIIVCVCVCSGTFHTILWLSYLPQCNLYHASRLCTPEGGRP